MAQQPASAPEQNSENNSLNIQKLKAALQSDPTNGDAWENLGAAYHQAKDEKNAVDAFKEALNHGYPSTLGKYSLATAYAALGERVLAVQLLKEVVDAGLVAPIGRDPEFTNLREDPQFAILARREKFMTEPCLDAKGHPEYRQLDFWVGDWEVFSRSEKVGKSNIQLILKDCVILENWTDLTGSQGKSFNKYDPVKQEWEQFWVEDNGSTNYFHGHLVNGEMRYELEQHRKDGKTLHRRLTFSKLPDSNVRQLSEASTDEGKTWFTEYDFTYRKAR